MEQQHDQHPQQQQNPNLDKHHNRITVGDPIRKIEYYLAVVVGSAGGRDKKLNCTTKDAETMKKVLEIHGYKNVIALHDEMEEPYTPTKENIKV